MNNSGGSEIEVFVFWSRVVGKQLYETGSGYDLDFCVFFNSNLVC